MLKQLDETVRFKKNYLQKVDDIDKHLHAYTLRMKDEDLEYEWRLQEIHSRKTMSIICSMVLLAQDVVWVFLLSDVNLTGKTIKIVIDVLAFICLYQVFFAEKVKKIKFVSNILR